MDKIRAARRWSRAGRISVSWEQLGSVPGPDHSRLPFAALRLWCHIDTILLNDHIDLKELKEAYLACIPQ